VHYVHDEAGHLLGEYNATGALVQETIWLGDTPVATLRPGTPVGIFYVHTDHLNTPRKVTRPSDNQPRWTWESDPFGTALANESPASLGTFKYNLRFPGQLYDAHTGLNYNYFRDYDPVVGRYAQSDPIGLLGGINTYSYALNNPIGFYDPYGLWVPPSLPQGVVDFSAGLGDALLLSFGDELRDLAGVSGGVNECATAYSAGAIASFAFGGVRVAYAGLAKGGSIVASSGASASAFRATLRNRFSLGLSRNWRQPNLAKYTTDDALRAAAGRTNPIANAYGAGIAAAGAAGATGANGDCGCQ
jgi:RHS repeat-associated protein